jgi:hypothetical protein
MMPVIEIEVTEQEIATLTLAARLRGTPLLPDDTPDWRAFCEAWFRDAYGHVQRAAGSLIAEDPVLSSQLMAVLQERLVPAPEPDTTTA